MALSGRVDQRTIRKYEKESKDMGKASFQYAWVLDATDEERERGLLVASPLSGACFFLLLFSVDRNYGGCRCEPL